MTRRQQIKIGSATFAIGNRRREGTGIRTIITEEDTRNSEGETFRWSAGTVMVRDFRKKRKDQQEFNSSLLPSDSMTKSLSEIVSLVKQLRDEVGQQRNEISYLRQLIENCAGCQHNRREPLRESCQANNPCYPGKNSPTSTNTIIFILCDYFKTISIIFSSPRRPVL